MMPDPHGCKVDLREILQGFGRCVCIDVYEDAGSGGFEVAILHLQAQGCSVNSVTISVKAAVWQLSIWCSTDRRANCRIAPTLMHFTRMRTAIKTAVKVKPHRNLSDFAAGNILHVTYV